MKKVKAYFYFFTGDLACRFSYFFNSEWLGDKYQSWMSKSSEIQDKYKLSGPWRGVDK